MEMKDCVGDDVVLGCESVAVNFLCIGDEMRIWEAIM